MGYTVEGVQLASIVRDPDSDTIVLQCACRLFHTDVLNDDEALDGWYQHFVDDCPSGSRNATIRPIDDILAEHPSDVVTVTKPFTGDTIDPDGHGVYIP
jgi:hypothetical protein